MGLVGTSAAGRIVVGAPPPAPVQLPTTPGVAQPAPTDALLKSAQWHPETLPWFGGSSNRPLELVGSVGIPVIAGLVTTVLALGETGMQPEAVVVRAVGVGAGLGLIGFVGGELLIPRYARPTVHQMLPAVQASQLPTSAEALQHATLAQVRGASDSGVLAGDSYHSFAVAPGPSTDLGTSVNSAIGRAESELSDDVAAGMNSHTAPKEAALGVVELANNHFVAVPLLDAVNGNSARSAHYVVSSTNSALRALVTSQGVYEQPGGSGG